MSIIIILDACRLQLPGIVYDTSAYSDTSEDALQQVQQYDSCIIPVIRYSTVPGIMLMHTSI